MNTVTSSTDLARMLETTFKKVDTDNNKGLDHAEFQSFYEVLKAGIAVDRDKQHVVSEKEYFQRMDKNGDGSIAEDEMTTTSVLMPADLTDTSLMAIVEYLKRQGAEKAIVAAQFLSRDDESPVAGDPPDQLEGLSPPSS